MRGLVLAAALLVSACGPTSRVLQAPASMLHSVDGVAMMTERPCTLEACAREVAAARAALGLPDAAMVVGVSTADTGYVYGGFQRPFVVVLDLADGERRAITIVCGPPDPETAPTPYPSSCSRVASP